MDKTRLQMLSELDSQIESSKRAIDGCSRLLCGAKLFSKPMVELRVDGFCNFISIPDELLHEFMGKIKEHHEQKLPELQKKFDSL